MNDSKVSMLNITSVSKRFGGVIALNKVSFHIERGEIVGLIGPNGAGKTTLINIISGFYKPDEGRIFLDGIDITKLPPFKRKGIARTFQTTKAFENLTTFDNVRIASYMASHDFLKSEKETIEILDMLKLLHKRDELAKNLTILERKRLELARALALKPRLLLLDEIMAGLKPYEADEIINILKELNMQGISILIVEHVIRTITKLCNRVIVLDYGVKIADGPLQEVINDIKVIKAYLGEEYGTS
jgi:branched-chain amino acid transport system ATP-binding protein